MTKYLLSMESIDEKQISFINGVLKEKYPYIENVSIKGSTEEKYITDVLIDIVTSKIDEVMKDGSKKGLPNVISDIRTLFTMLGYRKIYLPNGFRVGYIGSEENQYWVLSLDRDF